MTDNDAIEEVDEASSRPIKEEKEDVWSIPIRVAYKTTLGHLLGGSGYGLLAAHMVYAKEYGRDTQVEIGCISKTRMIRVIHNGKEFRARGHHVYRRR